MLNTKKVLIAEDERPLAMALEIKLKKVGIDAKAVFDGSEALNELSKNKYDLILLDLMMPVMDGWTVLNEINVKKLKVKVIVTSNLSQPEDIDKAKELGALDYLVKSDNAIADIADKVLLAIK